jgi:hypothetical protein
MEGGGALERKDAIVRASTRKNTMQEIPGQALEPPAIEAVYEETPADAGGARRGFRTLDDLWPGVPEGARQEKLQRLCKRFWSGLDRSGGAGACWEWQRASKANGYGVIYAGTSAPGARLYILVHRLAFVLWFEEIPEGAMVLHGCDNKLCANGAHLRAGTSSDNMLDAVASGAHACRAKLSGAEKEAIRQRYAAGGVTYRELADLYKVSYTSIGNIVNGRKGARR